MYKKMARYFLYVFYAIHDIFITGKDVYDKWEAGVMLIP